MAGEREFVDTQQESFRPQCQSFLLNELLVPCVFSDALYVCLAGSRIVHTLVQMHSESSPADTLVSGQIYSRPPSQNLVSTPTQGLYSTFL